MPVEPKMSNKAIAAETRALEAKMKREKAQRAAIEDDENMEDDELEPEPSPVKRNNGRASQRKNGGRRNDSNNGQGGGSDSSNVIYIGHLPPLFAERELTTFLKQFGGVTHVRVSRSTKTGGSRGYAFCRVESAEIATIVADTLSGYLLFDAKQHVRKRLVCHVVPADKVNPQLFISAKPASAIRQARKQAVHAKRPIAQMQAVTTKLVQREEKKRQQLQEMGIDYTDFPGYAAGVERAQKETTAPSKSAKAQASKESSTEPSSSKSAMPSKASDAEPSSSSSATKKKRKESIESNDEQSTQKKAKSDSTVTPRAKTEQSTKSSSSKPAAPAATSSSKKLARKSLEEPAPSSTTSNTPKRPKGSTVDSAGKVKSAQTKAPNKEDQPKRSKTDVKATTSPRDRPNNKAQSEKKNKKQKDMSRRSL